VLEPPPNGRGSAAATEPRASASGPRCKPLVLLTHANHLYSDRKQVRKMQPYPPLQTLIAAAALRRSGVEVAFFDATFDRDFSSALAHVRPDVLAVCEDNFNFLTKMCLLQNRALAFEMARAAGALGIPALINSSDATDQAGAYLQAGFDRVIQGELEMTLVETVRRWPQPPTPQPTIADLDELPSPAWDLLDIEPYRRAWNEAHGYFSMNLVGSRGCPYRCNWCAKPMYGDSYRYYSADRLAAEMECVKKLFHPDQLWFADDIFGLSSKWTREFASRVDQCQAQIPFRMQSRCDLMTRDTVEALARAGCVEVWMGAESGSQRILDAMEKGVRVEQIRQARENLRRHGIRACMFLQFGYLGEQWEDIESTIRLVRDTKPDDIGVSVSYPMPNTRFHQIVKTQLGAKANWSDSGELAAMFQGQLPAEFYRALADALHLEVAQSASSDDLVHAWEKVENLRCACC
jgi:anaerobic magnesium-protoporphyrin IX monomethyl ester cyclase